MSKQEQVKPSFMQELDQWTDANVIRPLFEADPYEPDNTAGGNVSEFQVAAEAVEKAIRQKVLESYRNGQAAGPKPTAKPRREVRR